MAQLRSLTKVCGSRKIPGTKGILRYIPTKELNSYPVTRAENGGTEPGDTKILDAPWDYVSTTGEGYWRSIPILIDTGNLRNSAEGEIGGLMVKPRVMGFLQGDSAEVQEFVDCMVAYSGCLILMVETKDGDNHVVGNLDDPAFLEPFEGDRETRVGYLMTWVANTGLTTPIYDAATHGINETPNA